MGGGPVLSMFFAKTAYAAEGDGCAMELDTTASPTLHDGDYTNGEQYTLTQTFPAGNYAYHFEADDVRTPVFDEVVLTISDGPAPCTENCNSNVLFLPGIEASRLYRPDYNGGTDQLWEPNIENDVTDLYLDEQGKSIRDDIYTKDILDEKNVLPLGQGNVYESFMDSMDEMKADGLINDWKAAPYDWRLSLEDILNYGSELSGGRIYYSGSLSATATPYIIQELRRLAATSRTGKVTIIAHSNGGLVAKALTDKLGVEAASLVDQIIFVAVPQVGTPQAIGALLHGYDQGLPFDSFSPILTSEVARQFASTAPMTYNLLPSSAYFTYVDDNAVTFDTTSTLLAPWRTKYGDFIHSSERLHTFIADESRTPLPVSDNLLFPISGKETLLSNAEVLHDTTLDNWSPPVGVILTEIAGWGEMTMSTLEYYEGRKTFCSTPGDLHTCTDVPALEYRVKEVMDGDGTVVVPSALWTPGATKYWVNYLKYNDGFWGTNIDRKHADILEVDELRTLIHNLVTNITPIDDANKDIISITQPLNPDPDTRLRFTLHSPLTLHLYDDFGNHTGISTTTGHLEENIPGSRYRTYGELKLIEAPASTTLRLVMNGYAPGSFTLDIEKKLGEVVIASTTFAAIPSSTTTIAMITVPQRGNIEDASPLVVDVDGNGTSDMTLDPVIGEIVLPDFTPPLTVASASGTLGANNWYTSSVAVTLSATDTGSGIQSTQYSLNGGITWNAYVTPLIVTNEGSTTLQYYSIDKAGNREATSALNIKIDKTAPKASISVDPTTKDLKIEGSDNLGTTAVVKNGDTYTITDTAGHTTKLFFQKTFTGNRLTYAKLTKVQYDNGTIVTLPSSYFVYLWQSAAPQTLLSQTIAVNDTYVVTAVYDKAKNKTTVTLKKKGVMVQTQQFTGLRIVKFTVDNSVVGYEI
jgi:pimeloyl-ACP methyl ester carboxylesterase